MIDLMVLYMLGTVIRRYGRTLTVRLMIELVTDLYGPYYRGFCRSQTFSTLTPYTGLDRVRIMVRVRDMVMVRV